MTESFPPLFPPLDICQDYHYTTQLLSITTQVQLAALAGPYRVNDKIYYQYSLQHQK